MTTLVGLDVSGAPVARRRRRTRWPPDVPPPWPRDGAARHGGRAAALRGPLDRVADGQVRWHRPGGRGARPRGGLAGARRHRRPRLNAQVCGGPRRRRVWSVCASAAEHRHRAHSRHHRARRAAASAVISTRRTRPPARPRGARPARSDAADRRHRPAPRRRAEGRRRAGGARRRRSGRRGPDDAAGAARPVEADVVVTDRLGPTSVLADLPADVEVIDVGKTPGRARRHPGRDQPHPGRPGPARAGWSCASRVATPSSSAAEVRRSSPWPPTAYRWRWCPGVSSALSAPAAAGIPVTHRGTVAAVHVTHGHGRLDDTAVGAVVRGEATLVVLMGISLLADHVARLLAAGASRGRAQWRSSRTPACPPSASRGPPCRRSSATCAARGVRAPAVIVVRRPWLPRASWRSPS